MSITVSSNDVIDSLREEVGEMIYKNTILRAQVKTLTSQLDEARNRITELEGQVKAK